MGTGEPNPSENIGYLSNTGQGPLKITNLPSQHSMLAIIGTPAKRHLNGVSLAGHLWPAYSSIWILSSFKNKRKKVVKVGTPLTKLSGFGHIYSYR